MWVLVLRLAYHQQSPEYPLVVVTVPQRSVVAALLLLLALALLLLFATLLLLHGKLVLLLGNPSAATGPMV